MDFRIRITILSLVFVLSTIFFWLAINEYLLTSKAQQSSNLQIVPHAREIECNPQGECYVHILGSTDPVNAVAGVTGHVEYTEFLIPDRVDHIGLCQQSSYGTDTTLQFQDDKENKILTFSVGSLRADEELKGGNACITTVVFKPTGVQQDPETTKLQLRADRQWKAGGLLAGVKGVFQAQVDDETIAVKIDSSVQWPPDDGTGGGPVPTGTEETPEGCQLDKGDCNCDSTTDLVDWEALRSSVRAEGGTCDLNGDGSANSLDVSIWIENNDLVEPIIITKE